MDSWTDRCGICERPVERVGRAKALVHANQFHQRYDHQPVPARHRLREPVATGSHWAPERRAPVRHLRVA